MPTAIGIAIGVPFLNSNAGGAWSPSMPLQGQSPSLWLRADQGVYTGGARQLYSADKGSLQSSAGALLLGNVDWTLGIWVYVDSSATLKAIATSMASSGTAGFELYINSNNTIGAAVRNSGGIAVASVTSVDTVPDGTWAYVDLEHDATADTLKIRINNGTAATSGSYSGTPAAGTAFVLGAYTGNNFLLDGRLSKGILSTRKWTAAERTYLYNLGNGRVYGELVVAATDGSDLLTSMSAYWNLNETSGTANAIDAHSTNDLTPTFAELVTNGAFASDTVWTKGTGWTIAAGLAASDGTQSADSDLEQAVSVRTGGIYASAFTVSNYVAGNVTAVVGGTEGTDRAANGTFNQTITVASTNSKILLRADLDFVGSVDNYSVVATQIPAADGPGEEIAADSVGSNHGVLTNFADPDTAWSSDQPTPIAALVDGSLVFDGTNDYVNVPDSSTFDFGTGVFSVSFWAKWTITSGANAGLITKSNADGLSNGLCLYIAFTDLDKIYFFNGSVETTHGSGLNNGAWHHIVQVREGTGSNQVKFYIDGALDATTATDSRTLSNALALNFGGFATGGTYAFKGSMSDARFFNTALSLANVQALYAGTDYTTGLVSRYKLDDGPQTGLVTGDSVVRWSSIEGSHWDFEQATPANRPLYDSSVVNGKPGIRFNGVNTLLRAASAFLTGTEGTVIVVYKLDATPLAYQVTLSSADEASSNKWLLFTGRDSTSFITYDHNAGGSVDALNGSTAVLANTTYVAVFQSDGTTINARLNGVAQTLAVVAGTNAGDWWSDALNRDNVVVGALKAALETSHLSGWILEIYAHPLKLNAGSLALWSGYSLNRYLEVA